MPNRWVVNASPLILLAKVRHSGLLVRLASELVIPASVAAEVRAGPPTDAARVWLEGEGAKWLGADLDVAPPIVAWDLGPGETMVLNWAFRHPGFEAILDDRAARKCAQVQGIPCRGTLGVILAAKRNGLIPAAKPLCDQLVEAGLLIEPTLLSGALRLVGESG